MSTRIETIVVLMGLLQDELHYAAAEDVCSPRDLKKLNELEMLLGDVGTLIERGSKNAG